MRRLRRRGLVRFRWDSRSQPEAEAELTALSATTAVGTVVLAVEPSEFVAVTRTRIVFP